MGSHNKGTDTSVNNKNMKNKIDTIIPTGDKNKIGQITTITENIGEKKYNYMTDPLDIIRKHRCNGVLDFQGRKITSKEWTEIQKCILNVWWLPPISMIDLRDTNISKEDIDPRLIAITIL
jgi:hypothetical protein